MWDVDALRPGFTYLLFERVNPEENEFRFYYLAWQPTLFASGSVVRIYGRKGGHQRALVPVPFPSLDDAWPLLRSLIRRRLRRGYRLVAPAFLRVVVNQSDLKESPDSPRPGT